MAAQKRRLNGGSASRDLEFALVGFVACSWRSLGTTGEVKPFARDVALDPGRVTVPRIAALQTLPSSE
jgi:hypothetical protein